MQSIPKDKKPFQCMGMVTVGKNFFWSITIPSVKLVASEEQITIHASTKKYVFQKSPSTIIWLNTGIYLSSVEIEHLMREYPKYIKFLVKDLDAVRENLKRLGYVTR